MLRVIVVELLSRVFDFAVIGISLMSASGPVSIVRALRVLRVLRLVSLVPSMRRVVSPLLTAVPGMASLVGRDRCGTHSGVV